MAEEDPYRHLISAFFAMEPTDYILSLSKPITNRVQSLILNDCINSKINGPSNLYMKNFLKKLILEVESNGGEVLDELYEQFALYITSVKGDMLAKDNSRVCKTISFLFPDGFVKVPMCAKSMRVEVPLRCSLNMLEGDTGCSIWPSSLYLSEFILSYPEIFTTKSCFEVGSGVGLVGILLALIKASEVILTDGDMSTLANLKLNLDLNQLSGERETSEVKCKYLSWETTSISELQSFTPDIVLGADVVYDPLCIPHLVRVLSILLKPKRSVDGDQEATLCGLHPGKCDVHDNCNSFRACGGRTNCAGKLLAQSADGPVAYITTVIRNVDTYNIFLNLASQARLSVVDITEKQRPLNLLPYMQSYVRSDIRLLVISMLGN